MIGRAWRRAIVAVALLLTCFVTVRSQDASAMPIFAQAYGIKCSVCHTIVPALNAYGRYVQRTGYASLNRDVLKTVLPVWLGVQDNGDAVGGVSNNSPTYTNSFGNVALHAAGYLAPDWTYHVQQWLLENDSTGGDLDTAWVTYNNLFHRDGHLFLGKVEAPGPSPFSQWMDISAFQPPEIVVGEHAYQLDANRWGANLAYVHGSLTAEAAWLGTSGNLISGADFETTPGTDKTFQYRVASARADQPLEYGAYGSDGSYIVSTGAVDHYTSIAPYVQRDPNKGIPGFLGIYQVANDSNPGLDASGNQLGFAHSTAWSAEIYEPFFNNNAVLSYRDEFTNDGLGDLSHYGNIDLSVTPLPRYQYLHAYVEAGLGANSAVPTGGPNWRWLIWWTTPLGSP
ncbi:MAG: hypothetical protein ACLQPV_03955 [Vulcanimicrobiaceae bacterium]